MAITKAGSPESKIGRADPSSNVKGLKRRGLMSGAEARKFREQKKADAQSGGNGSAQSHEGILVIRFGSEGSITKRLWTPPPLAQFQVYRIGTADLKVNAGWVHHAQGTAEAANVVDQANEVAVATVTVTGAGSIWLQCDVGLIQQSTENVTVDNSVTPDTTIDHTHRRVDTVSSSISYIATGSAPTANYDSGDIWSDFTYYVELARVDLLAGDAIITDQIHLGPVQIPDFSESYISGGL